MGRVSMCNETLLDECYLCLLAQVSFILEFFLRWQRLWLLWTWRFFSRKLWGGPSRTQGRSSRTSLALCGVGPQGQGLCLLCLQPKPTKLAELLERNLVTLAAGGRIPGAKPVRVVWDPPRLFAAAATMPRSSAGHAQAQAAPGTIQVRGFVLSTGEWCPVSPPLEVTFEEVEGFEGETLEERVAAWAQATHDATQNGSGA